MYEELMVYLLLHHYRLEAEIGKSVWLCAAHQVDDELSIDVISKRGKTYEERLDNAISLLYNKVKARVPK